MQITYSTLDLKSIWFWFLLLQLGLVFGTKRQWMSRDLLMPFEIVLITGAVLFVTDVLPSIAFFSVICTVAALTGLFHLYPASG